MREKRSHATTSVLTLRFLTLRSLSLRSTNGGSRVVGEFPATPFLYSCGQRFAFPIEELTVDT